MTGLLLWWLMLVAFSLLLATRRGTESPLLLAYVFLLSLIHAPGALNYTGRSVQLYHERETYAGFQLTLIGVSAMLSTIALLRVLAMARAPSIVSAAYLPMRTVYRVIVVGFLTYFVLTPLASMLPSGTALASTLAGLLPIGFWFWAVNAGKSHQSWLELLKLSLAAMLIPVATVLIMGFMGFGVALGLTIAVVVLVTWPKRWALIAVMPALTYLGLSLGASYFLVRDEIRAAVWGGEEFSERIEASMRIFTEFRFYDVNDQEVVRAIESRLNQNVLIGVGLQAHANGFSQLKYGATVPLWSLVPRALWPDKPNVGGGRDVVADFTGITFGDQTSVGVGNPFEFYINFGWPGVIGGFILLGALLAWHDRGLFTALRRNDLRMVILYGLPGLTLLQPGGNLMEIMIAYIGAQFVARGFVMALGSPFVARVLGFNDIVIPSGSRLVVESPLRAGGR